MSLMQLIAYGAQDVYLTGNYSTYKNHYCEINDNSYYKNGFRRKTEYEIKDIKNFEYYYDTIQKNKLSEININYEILIKNIFKII